MSTLRCAIVSAAAALAVAGEAAPAPAAPPAKPVATALDPAQAVVAEGRRWTYRQRDLDALLLVARRHLGRPPTEAERAGIERALTALLPARDDLVEAMRLLPACLDGTSRDRLLLDLLDYQAEARPAAVPAPAPAAPPAAATPPPATGLVLVRLPQLARTRTLPGLGKRSLVLDLSLCFPDEASAKACERHAPIIQDALLGCIDGLEPAAFAQPVQADLKQALTAAVRARIKDFPDDGVLITRIGDAAPEAGP